MKSNKKEEAGRKKAQNNPFHHVEPFYSTFLEVVCFSHFVHLFELLFASSSLDLTLIVLFHFSPPINKNIQ